MRLLIPVQLFITLLVSAVSCKNAVTDINIVNNGNHASRFQITDCGSYRKLVVLNPWQESTQTRFTYYLVNDGIIVPDTLPLNQIIRVPVRRIVCMSTTHLAMISELGMSDAIVGISGRNLVYDPIIREKISKGVVQDVGYESNLNKELVVSLRPDLLMAYGIDPSSAGYLAKLTEMGINIMYNADYLEETPLARAEWIKVFGALFSKEKQADSIYKSLTENYKMICDSVNTAGMPKPKVLSGGPWEDVWYVAPVNSFAIRLITDGGGDYIYKELVAGNAKPYTVESVFVKALDASIWLNPGAARSLDELFNYDYRLEKLPVSTSGSVFNCNNRLSPDGGNDYFESAVIHPDILLRDVASILHPELFPHHQLKYYKRLQ